MGQNKIFLALFLILFCACYSYADSGSDDCRVRVASIYTSEVGVRELTGQNDGPRVQEYLKTTGLVGNYPWCGAFVNWVLRKAGVVHRAKYPAQARSWFNSDARRVVYAAGGSWHRVQQGDLFALYYPNLKRIGHVGFIDEVRDNSVITVEGNTNEAGSREGQGVYRKIRMKRTIHQVSNWIDDL